MNDVIRFIGLNILYWKSSKCLVLFIFKIYVNIFIEVNLIVFFYLFWGINKLLVYFFLWCFYMNELF